MIWHLWYYILFYLWFIYYSYLVGLWYLPTIIFQVFTLIFISISWCKTQHKWIVLIPHVIVVISLMVSISVVGSLWSSTVLVANLLLSETCLVYYFGFVYVYIMIQLCYTILIVALYRWLPCPRTVYCSCRLYVSSIDFASFWLDFQLISIGFPSWPQTHQYPFWVKDRFSF